MITIKEERSCCGCGVCAEVCPTHCIEMRPGTLGSLVAYVEADKCVSCGKCERVCPMKVELQPVQPEKELFAAYACNSQIRFQGSSGGIAGTFASHMLAQGAIVFGAAFDEDLQLSCRGARNQTELQPLLKSKYLQSDLRPALGDIKAVLNAGQKVLFISTPCQVAALKTYLGHAYENLTTVDFFCHGVPSQLFFDACLKHDEEKRFGGSVTQYIFREKKRNGACPHYFTVQTKRGNHVRKKTQLYFHSSFYAAFQQYICLRESCYHCRFAGAASLADITVGDFHDIDRYVKGINRFDGVSTVILNTAKGAALWNACKMNLNAFPVSFQRLLADGVVFNGGTPRPEKRDAFVDIYQDRGVEGVVKTFLHPGRYWKERIYYRLPRFVRNLMKKVVGI